MEIRLIYLEDSMGLFDKLKHAKKEFDKKVEILDAPAGASQNDPIWKLRTINDINIAMCNRLTSKTNYGENMELLCAEERVFYVATEIDSQVHSLGFDQFFFDEAGVFAAEAPAALREVGAEERASVAERALAAVGGSLPEDHKERAAFIRHQLTEDMSKQLEELKAEYEAINDDFNRLLYAYLFKNHEKFVE